MDYVHSVQEQIQQHQILEHANYLHNVQMLIQIKWRVILY